MFLLVINYLDCSSYLFQLLRSTIFYCYPTIYIYSECTLGEYGVFISSLLLSGGAFIAQILSQIQKSKCKNITCLGSSCIREVET